MLAVGWKYSAVLEQKVSQINFFFQPLEELSRNAASTNTALYQRTIRKRRRKCRTEPSSYVYSKRESWSSATDNSAEARKQLESGQSAESTPAARQTVNMDREANELNEVSNTRPPFFRGAPISSLSPTAREMTGGQPDYVWIDIFGFI